MTGIEQKALIERLRQRSNSNYMLMSDPPKPAPDRDCHAAADLLEQLLPIAQKFDAFRQEVSDTMAKAIKHIKDGRPAFAAGAIGAFVIPKPKPKPDPLVDVLLDMELSSDLEEGQHDAKWIRNKLDALGFEIREKNDG